jgi:hypothetical protein
MKAALVIDGIVQNIIVWDETCEAPEGFSVVVLEDDVSISVDWVQQGDAFVNPNPPAPIEVIPLPTVADLRSQLDIITAQLIALEAN